MAAKTKLAFLTAGAAGMYCGSCMHDNSLARAMIAAGCDVQLIPTYTPIRTDEQDVTIEHVYFGGINLYLQQKIPLFRHIPAMLDRMFDNPWLIRKLTAKASETSPELLGSLQVSMLKGIHGNQRKEVRRLVNWLKREIKPDALLLTNMLIAGFVPYFKSELDVPVAVMLQGDDIFLDSLPEKYRTAALKEIRRLGESIDGFVFHSQFYADKMNDWFSLDPKKTSITPLTIDTSDFENQPSNTSEIVPQVPEHKTVIGYLARIAKEKGLHVLIDAFIKLKKTTVGKDAHLLIAGWLGDHNRTYANEQTQKLDDAGLSEDYHFLGTIERPDKVELLRRLDIFSVPTTYEEPKGLFVLEAMAAGVPVVQPNHGAFPEVVESTGGGILCAADDPDDLADKLLELVADQERRKSLGATGRKSVTEKRNAPTMARDMLAVFEKLMAEHSQSHG